ncbi:MAG: amidase [Candidatus Dormibacteraceae bacterium]
MADLLGGVEEHLQRISRLDGRVHAYVHVDPDARGQGAGTLAGLTVAVKDTQPVAGMPWTCGSVRWRDRVAGFDAAPVAAARAAGAAILGKTNTPELAAAVGTTNDLFPATENPWRPGITPGGSSGGSAAAVAAGLATVAFGDDYGGSIRIPAACCGVVGLRPSPGRVADEAFDAGGLNSRGPLCRSVAEVRLALQVMLGEAVPEAEHGPWRIGAVLDTPLEADGACLAACRRAADALRRAGHDVREVGWDPEPVADAYRIVRRFVLAGWPGEPSAYGAAVRGLIEAGRGVVAVDFHRAHRLATSTARRCLNDLVEARFDAILTPTLGMRPMAIASVPTFLGQDWDRYTQFVLPASFARLPAISIPAGLDGGLPTGVQLVGRYRREWALLNIAEALEAESGFGFVTPPGFE